MNSKRNPFSITGGALVIAGSLLPWGRVVAPTLGIDLAVKGTDDSAGWIFAGLGALIIVFSLMNQRWSNAVAIALGLAAAIKAVSLFTSVPEAAGSAYHPGVGAWLMLAGAIIAIVGGIMAVRRGSTPGSAAA